MSPNEFVIERFDNRGAQVALAVFAGVLGVLGLAGLLAGSPTGAVYLGVAALFAYRAFSSSAVVVDNWGIETRSMMRTHRYAFTDLDRVEVAVGRTGMTGFDREYLLIHRRDGRDVAFKELNSRRAKGGELSVVARAAVSINRRLSA